MHYDAHVHYLLGYVSVVRLATSEVIDSPRRYCFPRASTEE